MTWPRPVELFVLHACTQAAMTAALAPLFGNNPADMAPIGFVIGFLTGTPVYVVAEVRRYRRARP